MVGTASRQCHNVHLRSLHFETFTMSSTELTTVTLGHSVTTTPPPESHERALPRLQDAGFEPTDGRRTRQELDPVDGGFAAWRLLCAAFVFEALLWGKFTLDDKLNRADECRVKASRYRLVFSRSTTPRFQNLPTIATSLSWVP